MSNLKKKNKGRNKNSLQIGIKKEVLKTLALEEVEDKVNEL